MWKKNLEMIDKHNEEYALGKHSFTMAMNAFGDMTNGEFRQVMNTLQKQKYETREVFPVPSLAQEVTQQVCGMEREGLCNSCEEPELVWFLLGF